MILAHAALLPILLIFACAAISAQAMIGNTHSTDVVQPGGFYVIPFDDGILHEF